MLTFEQINNKLAYNPTTGTFRRRNKGKQLVGTIETRKGSRHLRISINGHRYYAHHLAWFLSKGTWATNQLDHINGDGLDNRISNLREATHSQNQINKAKRKNTTSKYKGVSWVSSRGRWRAQITIEGIHYHLGYFATEEFAYKVYKHNADKLHGEFQRNEVIE